MVIYTAVDEELDRMKSEICDPIMQRTEEVVEQFFPIDQEYYNKYSQIPINDWLKQIFKPVELSVLDNDKINVSFGDATSERIAFIKQTIRRYGYLPLSYIDDLRKDYSCMADSIMMILEYYENNIDSLSAVEKSINHECADLLKKIKEADKGLEEAFKICEKKQPLPCEDIIEKYERIIKKRDAINKKRDAINKKLGIDEETELCGEINEEKIVELQEELHELQCKWQYQLREFLMCSFFIHRCKCYSNNVRYKTISEEELINLVNARTNIKRRDYKEYIKKCIDTFAVINRCSADGCTAMTTHAIQYPEKIEEILFNFLNIVKWRDELREFDRIHREPKHMAKSLEEKFYRTEIADLENEVFAKREDYDYELCCAWNELGGFGISAIIAGTLFYQSKIISKNFLVEKTNEKQRDKFYKELQRCCQVLVDFSRSESWLMGMELTHIVFQMYRQQWAGKAISSEEVCISTQYLADTLESIPLKAILDNYSYDERMIGRDGFPRRDFDTLWEDEKEQYRDFFYRVDLQKYADRSNVNRFYVRVFQIVFRCVNGNSWK